MFYPCILAQPHSFFSELSDPLSRIYQKISSLKLQICCLLRARSSLTYRQTIECRFTLKLVHNMIITYSRYQAFPIGPHCVVVIIFSRHLYAKNMLSWETRFVIFFWYNFAIYYNEMYFVHLHFLSSLYSLGFIKRIISDAFELFSYNEEIDIFILPIESNSQSA